MRKIFTPVFILSLILFQSCDPDRIKGPKENAASFREVGEIILTGGETAAEISAFDPRTKKLFVTNATKPAIDVIDLSDPTNPIFLEALRFSGGGVNSVSVKDGLLAAAIEAEVKTNPGKVLVWNTEHLHDEPVTVPVGALPDMVAFSDDGKFIVTANEGESSEDNLVDPNGSVSVIEVKKNFKVTTLDFSPFENQLSSLKQKGYRVFNAPTLAADTEPEYVAISDDSKTAWVTLQENNAVARINLVTKSIEQISPLGFKDHLLTGNGLDPSDRDGAVTHGKWPVQGMYLPDGIAFFGKPFQPFVITVNEGDSRIRPTSDDALPPTEEGDIYNEEERIKDVDLDPVAFPNADVLQADAAIGRLKITNTLGDKDGDRDYDNLYAFGARSFSIWNGHSGKLIFDSGSELEKFVLSQSPSLYDDSRSDDKGAEPENVTIGKMGRYTVGFIGLERADAVVIVELSNPTSPVYLQVLHTGDAPEGVLFVPATDSPNGKSILIVSAEGDGSVKIFQPGM